MFCDQDFRIHDVSYISKICKKHCHKYIIIIKKNKKLNIVLNNSVYYLNIKTASRVLIKFYNLITVDFIIS